VNNDAAKKLAKRFGLNIDKISWDDNARNQNSPLGPCISDVSLVVNNRLLPIIRSPNFEDVTWDLPMDKINLTVGNELDAKLYTVTLQYYLENFPLFLSKAVDFRGAYGMAAKGSLLAGRDSHAVCSAQACLLPMPAGGESTFNVGILNYQSRAKNPAVLAIVATAKGTSAQIVECDTFSQTQKLYFNNKGQKASFVGQRLSDNRRERGVAVEGKMSQEEKEQNVILLIQVPLKYKRPEPDAVVPDHYPYYPHPYRPHPYTPYYPYPHPASAMALGAGGMAFDPSLPPVASSWDQAEYERADRPADGRFKKNEKGDVEEAIVSVGKDEGPFDECNGLAIERDPKYPVRLTFQFYRSTSTGTIEDSQMKAISDQFKEAQKGADFIGSLVVKKRPTEPDLSGRRD